MVETVNPLVMVAVAVVTVALTAAFWKRRASHRRPVPDDTPAQPAPAPTDSRVIGRWSVGERIGSGSYATVFRGQALHGEDREEVAIKILDQDVAEDDSERARFEREVAISGRLSHPNIVRLIDWDARGAQPYLVMELVEGPTLRRLIRAGALSYDDFSRIFRALLDAVRYAHSVGVVHRDLKPENVICTTGGVPKIGDFGIARGTLLATVTTSGHTMGTMGYLSPERFVGATTDDPRCDQYSLGVIGYEMLAGRRPWPNTVLGDILLGISQAPPPDLRHTRPDTPPAVVEVIEKLMSQTLDDRFPDLDTALRAFEAADVRPTA